MTLEESDKITNFLDQVINEAFDAQVAPLIRIAFNAELQTFKTWLDNVTNKSA